MPLCKPIARCAGRFRSAADCAKAGAMMSTALSLAMLVSLALIGGALYLWRRPGYRRQAVLMLVAAAVALFNVAIWTLPDGEGRSPVGQLANGQ